MTDRDTIAYLQDLATSHSRDGNHAAALSAWKQLLAIDPANTAARQGVTIAESALDGGPVPTESSEPDADATMMFHPDSGFGRAPAQPGGSQSQPFGSPEAPFGNQEAPFGSASAPFGAPPATAQPFDADRTQAFNPGMVPPRPAGQPFDADRTMAFNPGMVPPPAAAPAPGGFDADRTMAFNPGMVPPPAAAPAPGGFDADRTMAFNPGMVPPPAKPAQGGFDADRTMAFNPSMVPPAPAAPAPSGFDPDRTMQFNPSMAPPAPAAPAQGGFDADRTMLFGTPAPAAPAPAAFSFGAPATPAQPDWLGAAGQDADQTALSPEFPPPPAPVPTFTPTPAPPAASKPAPAPAAAAGGAGGSRQLEDFVMPTGGLEMPPPPSSPSFDLPPTVGGSKPAARSGADAGFSFELPPPPAKGGGSFDLPALPSVGLAPPPTYAPPPPPPPAAPAAKRSGAQFGEVEPGEAESLAAPTIGLKREATEKEPEPGTPEHAEREAELRRQYEVQYGRSTAPAGPPKPTQLYVEKPKSRVGLYILGGLVLVLAVAYAGITIFQPEPPPPPPPPPPTDEEMLAPDVRVSNMLDETATFVRQGKVDDAAARILQAQALHAEHALPANPRFAQIEALIQAERAFQTKHASALKFFCLGDYKGALTGYTELEQVRPEDKRAGEFIERIYFNVGIEELQVKRPWEAAYYFEKLLERNPNDQQAKQLLAYSSQFRPGQQLGDQYTRRVDPLVDRSQGCERR